MVRQVLNINLKGKNGIYDTFKLVDAFKSENNTTFVLIHRDETENNLLKIYISKYENGKLHSISEEEWNDAKACMSSIVTKAKEYECVKMPSFLELDGVLKPCLIATISYFEEHYNEAESTKITMPDELLESKFRFTGGSEWKVDNKEETDVSPEVNTQVQEEKEEVTEVKEEKVIQSTDYKSQKENLMNIISRGLDDVLESKNKEIVELTSLVETLERDLRKAELEKKQAINIINMYHDKIKKLNDTIKDGRE